MTTGVQQWLRCYRPRTGSRIRLVCFPHAGGSAPFFRPWTERLPVDIELTAVQYPGRLDRITDVACSTLPEMATRVAAAVQELADRPVALFGHSMGALVAYEVARRLEDRNLELRGLFVSARPGPRSACSSRWHLASDEELWTKVRDLGGTADDVFNSQSLRKIATAALRSDYRLVETYRWNESSATHPIRCPIAAFVGACDSEAGLTDVGHWSKVTSSDLWLKEFPGGHFFLSEWPAMVVDEIVRVLER